MIGRLRTWTAGTHQAVKVIFGRRFAFQIKNFCRQFMAAFFFGGEAGAFEEKL
jgi:hypothetical protein